MFKSLPRVRAGVGSYETRKNHTHAHSFALVGHVAFCSRSSYKSGADRRQAEQKVREKIGGIPRRGWIARFHAESFEIGPAFTGRTVSLETPDCNDGFLDRRKTERK